MDWLHSCGVSATHYLQTHYGHNQDFFFFVSMATDLHNTFFLLFPIWFHVQQAEAVRLVWVAVVGHWTNLILKWLLFGERPYWWVQETGYYGNSSRPVIEQFPMTCETGPGKNATFQCFTRYVFSSLWVVFCCVQVCVCLSRVFLAAHFPHQVIAGVFSGILVAETLSRACWILDASLHLYFLTSLLLLSLALLLFLLLGSAGVDLLWSLEKARRYCHQVDWINMGTSPFASLFRNTGTLLGLGLGLHSPLCTETKRVVAGRQGDGTAYRFICVSATLVLLYMFDSAFRPAVHSGALLYLLSFCKSATVPLVISLITSPSSRGQGLISEISWCGFWLERKPAASRPSMAHDCPPLV
uniref:Glucose-6-phosphatase n=1 Tax=Myripristis murdjan TaxID=586833 RepID=A0A668ALE7_9TELE